MYNINDVDRIESPYEIHCAYATNNLEEIVRLDNFGDYRLDFGD